MGDFACERWRDEDNDQRRWGPKPPVWEILTWGSVATVRALGTNQEASVASGDLRPATDDEIARARG